MKLSCELKTSPKKTTRQENNIIKLNTLSTQKNKNRFIIMLPQKVTSQSHATLYVNQFDGNGTILLIRSATISNSNCTITVGTNKMEKC